MNSDDPCSKSYFSFSQCLKSFHHTTFDFNQISQKTFNIWDTSWLGDHFTFPSLGVLGIVHSINIPFLGNHNRWLVQEDWLFAHFLYLQFGASIKPRSGLNAVRFDLVGPDDEIEVVLLQEFRQGLRSEHRQAAWRQVEWCGREAEPECQGNEWAMPVRTLRPLLSNPSPLTTGNDVHTE